jgi:hypothetical protein
VDIYGNTVYLDNTNLTNSDAQAVVIASATTNVRFFNNILTTSNGIRLMDAARKQTGMVFRNNDFWAATGFDIVWSGKSYTSVAAFQAGAGQSGNLSKAPEFVGVVGTKDEFRLSAASVLRDAGVDLWTVSIRPGNPGAVDFYGDALPGAGSGGFSIGADEA